MGFFSSATSQLHTSDKPETQAEELFTDFDETVAKLQQFELEAFEDNNNNNNNNNNNKNDKPCLPESQSRMKE